MNLKYNLGVAEDPRSPEERVRDYSHSQLAGAPIIEWKEKKQAEWKRYVEREQDGSLSCMAQGGAKGYEILTAKIVSAHPPYRSRLNYPSGGMWTQNLGDVYKHVGTTLETLDVSQRIGESEMNRDITVETPFKIGGYAFPNNKSIDEIAQAIETHKHCIITIHGSKEEWTAVPKYNGKEIDFGHGICAVDYFIWEGEKAILLEDSTGHFNSIDGKGARIITESYLKMRCSSAIYFTLEAPQYLFSVLMRFGSKGNEVKELQKRLNREGMAIEKLVVDGDFGKRTQSAVKNYQKNHGLVADGIVGAKTRAELNKPVNA